MNYQRKSPRKILHSWETIQTCEKKRLSHFGNQLISNGILQLFVRNYLPHISACQELLKEVSHFEWYSAKFFTRLSKTIESSDNTPAFLSPQNWWSGSLTIASALRYTTCILSKKSMLSPLPNSWKKWTNLSIVYLYIELFDFLDPIWSF